MMVLLLATNNLAKVARIRKLLKAARLEVEVRTPADLGLEAIEVSEGSDLVANALDKARAYRGKTDLPILGTDTGFFMEGESLDPAMVKRNALQGRDEGTLTQAEIRDAILDFYCALIRKRGGQAEAYWKDTFAVMMTDGSAKTAEAIRPVVMTDQVHGPVDDFFPMRSLYYSKATGKYACDSTEADELKELAPYTQALAEAIGGNSVRAE